LYQWLGYIEIWQVPNNKKPSAYLNIKTWYHRLYYFVKLDFCSIRCRPFICAIEIVLRGTLEPISMRPQKKRIRKNVKIGFFPEFIIQFFSIFAIELLQSGKWFQLGRIDGYVKVRHDLAAAFQYAGSKCRFILLQQILWVFDGTHYLNAFNEQSFVKLVSSVHRYVFWDSLKMSNIWKTMPALPRTYTAT